MIRIAVIIAKMDSGGQKSLVMEYYRHINRDIVQFDFICDSDSNSIPDDEIEQLGGRVYRIPPYQHIFANMKEMKRIFKENRYPIMHAYNSTMNLFPLYVAKQTGIPVRISESLSMANEHDKKTIIKKILRPMSKLFATHFISCGEDCGRWQFGDKLFSTGKVDVFKTVVNADFNKYDIKVRSQTRDKHGWNDKIVIGHIGRFAPQKNTIRVIEIFNAISKKEPSAHMCLIGDGKLKQQVLNKIAELNLQEKVSYLGRREDIQQFYNAMDCFLLPSLYEGLPVVGLEAQSCGLPVFFSSNITNEASACQLCHFIDLGVSNEKWADQILMATRENMPIRRSYASEVAKAGFDSTSEALRLQDYYLKALEVNKNGIEHT